MFQYTAFGLNIASEIEFPEMFLSKNTELVDVHIRIGKTPKFIKDGRTENSELQITPNEFLMHFKDVARYYATEGNLIIAEPYPDANIKKLRLYLLCNAMAAIVHQRKLIPLHCSGIICKTGVAIIVGPSGAGKSTTVKALTQKGYSIFADDVCVIKSEKNKVLAIPSYPMMKLWDKSFDLLELENAKAEDKIISEMNKYGVFFHDEFISEWKPVVKIFTIVKEEDSHKVLAEKQTGIDAFKIIAENTYRNYYVEPMKLNAIHFEMVSNLLRQCEVYKITRPADKNSIAEVVKIIEEKL